MRYMGIYRMYVLPSSATLQMAHLVGVLTE